jgi:hypothetical protein
MLSIKRRHNNCLLLLIYDITEKDKYKDVCLACGKYEIIFYKNALICYTYPTISGQLHYDCASSLKMCPVNKFEAKKLLINRIMILRLINKLNLPFDVIENCIKPYLW